MDYCSCKSPVDNFAQRVDITGRVRPVGEWLPTVLERWRSVSSTLTLGFTLDATQGAGIERHRVPLIRSFAWSVTGFRFDRLFEHRGELGFRLGRGDRRLRRLARATDQRPQRWRYDSTPSSSVGSSRMKRRRSYCSLIQAAASGQSSSSSYVHRLVSHTVRPSRLAARGSPSILWSPISERILPE